jgi:SAM-dependent methyltransferase
MNATWFIPTRQRGVELLDAPDADAALATRSLRDVAMANRLFGGTSAVLAALRPLLRRTHAVARADDRALTLLDVGTGLGDIPARARRLAQRHGVALSTLGLERTLPMASAARARAKAVCVGDGLSLPFADRCVDVVTCSQVLHHFADADATRLLREMDRVARRLVIVADLRRSWLAAAGIWAASFPLGFHAVSRHDGVLSVLRGYRVAELASLVRTAVGTAPLAWDHRGFRVLASWSPA